MLDELDEELLEDEELEEEELEELDGEECELLPPPPPPPSQAVRMDAATTAESAIMAADLSAC